MLLLVAAAAVITCLLSLIFSRRCCHAAACQLFFAFSIYAAGLRFDCRFAYFFAAAADIVFADDIALPFRRLYACR